MVCPKTPPPKTRIAPFTLSFSGISSIYTPAPLLPENPRSRGAVKVNVSEAVVSSDLSFMRYKVNPVAEYCKSREYLWLIPRGQQLPGGMNDATILDFF